MRKIRQIVFWAHLVAGVVGGVVILIMSVTGLFLAFEEKILLRADGHKSSAVLAGEFPASIERMLLQTASASPSLATIRSDASLPVAITFGPDKTQLFNSSTGAHLGEGANRTRAFLRRVNEWHRWLGRSETSRSTGKAITGACNLIFFFLLGSGLVLWCPRKWSWNTVRKVLFFDRALREKSRDCNWHNVIGFWCALPLGIIVLTGVIMSYPWANRLLFKVAGSQPPEPRRSEAKGNSSTDKNSRVEGFDSALRQITREFPEWKQVRARFANGHVTFTVDTREGRPQLRNQLTAKLPGGEIVRRDLSANYDRGRRWRLLARFLHTGEAAGLLGQIVAALASAGASLLVITGLALVVRRVWRRTISSTAPGAVAEEPS